MTWERIPKQNSAGRPSNPNPQLRAVRAKGRSARFQLNSAALLILSEHIVFLRNGESLAVRGACENDLPYTIRKITKARCVGATGLATVGQVFELVRDGDLFLLNPLKESK